MNNEDTNKKLKEFITAVGAISEVWAITYKSFISQGLSKDDAILNTQAFMQTFVNTIMDKKGE